LSRLFIEIKEVIFLGGIILREFMILIGEVMCVVAVQIILGAVLDESGHKSVVKIINIACILICYFLLFRYVYNNFIGEITMFVNFF
jgi:hypothetical protein